MTSKVCNDCGESKEVSAFSASKTHKDGREGRCKECKARRKREAVRAKVAADPDYHRKTERARRTAQLRGRCHICRSPSGPELCDRCAQALDLFDHDASRLGRAMRYVQRPRAEPPTPSNSA